MNQTEIKERLEKLDQELNECEKNYLQANKLLAMKIVEVRDFVFRSLDQINDK